MKNYPHIVSEFYSTPWAILPQKLEVLTALVEEWRAGREGAELVAAVAAVGKTDRPAVRRSGSVAILPVYGVIAPKMNMFSQISGGTSAEQLTADFRAALADPEVKAIILDVDSPGGSVFGVDELASEIYAARGKKPILAQVSPTAASAAYWLAAQADEIAVAPSGEVGSIGAFAQHADLSKMEEQKGIKTTLISAGKFKTEGNQHEPLGAEARDYLQSRVDDYYGMFVRAVARGRGVNPAAVTGGMGEGRMVSAPRALQLGMADKIATLEQTVERLKAQTGAALATVQAQAVQTSAVTLAANLPPNASPEAAALAAPAVSVHQVSASEPGSQSTATAVISMEAQVENSTAQPNAAAENLAAENASAIVTLAMRHNMGEKAAGWLKAGKTVAEVQTEILAGMEAKPLSAAPRVSITSEHATDLARKTPGIRAARFIRAVAANPRREPREVANWALENLKDPGIAAALGASSSTGGGFIVPEDLSSEIIEFLRPLSVVRSLGPIYVPMPRGSVTLPKLAGGATASYIGENTDIPATAPSFGQVKLTAKKLAAHVPISNDLVRYAGPGLAADIIVRDDLAQAIAQAEDLAFIRSQGTAYSPKGLRYQAAAANILNANATVNLANTRADLGKMRKALRSANVRFIRPGFIMSPRTENYLMFLADAQGKPVFYEEMTSRRYDVPGGGPGEVARGSGVGTLLGYPYKVTTQIPENLNELGASNEAELYFCDFADVAIGEVPVMVVDVSQEASYKDSGGTLQSAWSLDQTVVRMIEEHDLAVRHAESVAVMKQLIWI